MPLRIQQVGPDFAGLSGFGKVAVQGVGPALLIGLNCFAHHFTLLALPATGLAPLTCSQGHQNGKHQEKGLRQPIR